MGETCGGCHPVYLEKRRRRWYAIHEIPEDVRDIIGSGKQFFKGLETEDKAVAKRRAAILEVQWLSEIERARKGTTDHAEQDASFWRKTLRDTPEEHRGVVLDLIADEAQARVDRALVKAGYDSENEPGAMDLPEVVEATRFHAIASGKLVKLDEHLDEWLATLANEAKSKDMKKSTITKFAEAFPYVQDVKRKDVQRWVNGLIQDEQKKVATVRRSLSELRGYWTYLVSIEVAEEDNLPFERLILPKESAKATVKDARRRFEAQDIVALLRAAEAKEDTQLADLIRLGMWTGARLEELCALKVERVGVGFFEVEDAKTVAGCRKVPIHPKLAPTMARLVEASKKAKDPYVLAGLTENKYKDRSNAIGKRFGRLKTDADFGPQYVFHSIRHTVAWMFKNARVDEALAADILGHEHDTMTFGRYGSDQAMLETLGPIVGLLDFPL